MPAGSPKSPNNVTSTFFNTVHLLPKDLRFEHGGAKLAPCPGRCLTSLRPCAFEIPGLVCKRKLTTLALSLLSDFKELNQTAPRFMTSKSVHPWESAEFFPGEQRRNFSHPFQVDDAMQTEIHKTLYSFYPLVCAGWTSILNLLSEMFSTLLLSEMLDLFINYLISIFREFSTKKS